MDDTTRGSHRSRHRHRLVITTASCLLGERPHIADKLVTHMRRVGAALLALVVGGLVVSGAFSPSNASASSAVARSTYFPPTGFGGYQWYGDVTQVSAQWRIPTIRPSHAFEDASTWVGAQNEQGGTPFIQLGTTENNVSVLGEQYQSFWSDPTVGFHPQVLGVVRAGDLVSADMNRTAAGWVLTFKDLTQGKTEMKKVRYGGGSAFSQAEWLQEDPSPNGSSPTDLPYPETSMVQIQDLLVNGAPPILHLQNGQVLIASNGIILVPSAVENDMFHFLGPTGQAKIYLDAARSLDTALSPLDADIAHWSDVPRSRREQIVEDLNRSYRENAAALGTLSLPNDDATLLAHRIAAIEHDLSAWTRAGLAEHGTAFEKFVRDAQISQLADKVRSDIGLPPT